METHLFWGQKVNGEGHKSQKHCRRGCLHSCEYWLLLVSDTDLSATSSVQMLLAQAALPDNWSSLSLFALLSVQSAKHGNGKMCQQQTPM